MSTLSPLLPGTRDTKELNGIGTKKGETKKSLLTEDVGKKTQMYLQR